MKRKEEKVEKIKQAFFEYAKDNELSAFDTSNYFARQIMIFCKTNHDAAPTRQYAKLQALMTKVPSYY
jgi:superfamily II DNA/RNA helicase